VLDPALGTGTFLVEVIDIIHKTMTAKWQKAGHPSSKQQELWNEYVPKHLLLRLYGFELLMAPYAIAHMKIGLKLWETGYRFGSNERAHIYLTNSLEPPSDVQMDLPDLLPALAHEAQAVNEVKRLKCFTVVIGNPPYSVSSVNKSNFIEREMEIYKEDVRSERNLQPLSDDYIKFIRFAHWNIDKANSGISGMITNNTYLSGVIHRGMRRKLLDTFDEIYIPNLHGSLRICEKTPDGKKDENVFEIQQGVSIALLVKLEKPQKKGFITVICGDREKRNTNTFLKTMRKELSGKSWKLFPPTIFLSLKTLLRRMSIQNIGS
ncbi:MAG: Eco57I restriction-modification methylase domain-containing protein, partial [Pseudomonadota bacterium]